MVTTFETVRIGSMNYAIPKPVAVYLKRLERDAEEAKVRDEKSRVDIQQALYTQFPEQMFGKRFNCKTLDNILDYLGKTKVTSDEY